MSYITNQALNSRSMNGILSITDGIAILENGLLQCDNINTSNINSIGINGNSLNSTGIITSNTNGNYTIPTSVTNSQGLIISYGNTINSGSTDFTTLSYTNDTTKQGFRFNTKSSTTTLTNIGIIEKGLTYFSAPLTNCSCVTQSNGTNDTSLASCAFCYNNFCNLTSNQTLAGVKNFSSIPTCSLSNPTLSTQLITKGFADATYTTVNLLSNANIWTSTNTFNSYLPTSTIRATTLYQFVNLDTLTVTLNSYLTTASASSTYQPISLMSNYCNLSTTQTIGGLKTFSNSIITDTITTTNRVNTSYIYTGTNNQIIYNMYSGATVTTPTTSLMGGYSTQYNTLGFGATSFISYGGGGTSNTGGFEFSYLNSIVSKALLATFYPSQITFSQPLTISGTTITNLSALNANPLSTDNNTNIATTSFVKAQSYLTTSTASTTYCDLLTAQVINGSKTFTQPLTISGTTITNLSALNANPLSTDNNTNIATTSFVKAQSYLTTSTASTIYCDLSTAQVINGSKTFTSNTIFQDITNPTNFSYNCGHISYNNTFFNINSKKNNSNFLAASVINFLVSPNNVIADDIALIIQGSNSIAGAINTKVFVSGSLYVAGFSYLSSVNIAGGTVLTSNANSTSTSTGALTIQNGGLGVAQNICCGGNLIITGTTNLTGQLTISNSSISGLSQLSTLTYLPVFPDSTAKIASTAFVSTNFCDLSTAQIIDGTKTFTDFNVNTINLTYTTTPIYLQQEIGYTIYANGINDTIIPTTLADVTGTSITITAGTWILEYNITIVPTSSLNYKIFVSGFSYSATSFTNVSGTGNSYFHNKASLTGQTITASYTINYSQIFYNSTGYKTIYLLALSSLNSGAGYYYNHHSTFGIYALPTSYIQATRIA